MHQRCLFKFCNIQRYIPSQLKGDCILERKKYVPLSCRYNCGSICDPLIENPALSANIELKVRDDFICTGRFPAELRLLHQGGNYRGF